MVLLFIHSKFTISEITVVPVQCFVSFSYHTCSMNFIEKTNRESKSSNTGDSLLILIIIVMFFKVNNRKTISFISGVEIVKLWYSIDSDEVRFRLTFAYGCQVAFPSEIAYFRHLSWSRWKR